MIRGSNALLWVALMAGLVFGCQADPAPGDPNAYQRPQLPALDLTGVDWGNPDCDPLIPESCALPFPSNKYLVEDATRVTGYTLTFGPTTLPANSAGSIIDPVPYQRMDGYGVGSAIVIYFPGLDDANLPNENQIADSLADDAPILLYEVKASGISRVPYFAELDTMGSFDGEAPLFVRPAVIPEEATRYIVAFRNLMHKDGNPVASPIAFQALIRGQTAGTPLESRQARFDEVFGMLQSQGIAVEDLTLAWDFNTASGEAIHGPMLHVRDEGFKVVGEKGPELVVTEQAPDNPNEPGFELFDAAESPHIAIQLRGTFEVPHFLTETKVPGDITAWMFNDPVNGLPQINGTRKAEFRIRIPWSALDGTPTGIIMHGHGQNGAHDQIATEFYDKMAEEEHFVIIGCNMIGMSYEDLPAITALIYDLGFFYALTDRIHQAMFEHLAFIRAVRERLPEVPELADYNIVMDPENVFYSGISQGGIYGGTLTALSQDFTRAHLGVPGSNFGLIVRRSANFKEFFSLLHVGYPHFLDKTIGLALVQTLWDQVDSVSYYRHISKEPFPNTPKHDVLLATATGDWAVALVTNEIITRSDLGVALLPDYGKDVPLVKPVTYPHQGSGLVNYSFGNPWPDPGPVAPYDEVGNPHNKGRHLEWHNQQMLHFFRTGEIIDVCGGDGCNPD